PGAAVAATPPKGTKTPSAHRGGQAGASAAGAGPGAVMQQASPPAPRSPAPVSRPGRQQAHTGGASPGLSPEANGHGRVFASPLARRLARELGVDVGGLKRSRPPGHLTP